MDTPGNFLLCSRNCNFRPRPLEQRELIANNSIDDKLDDLHYYTTFIKFGIEELHMRFPKS